MPGWLGEEVERLPEVLQAGLKPQWNDWLRRRYETTAALRRAWSAGEQSPGQEMITNADLGLGLEGWVLERQPGAEATAALSEEAPAALPHARSVCVTVAKPGIQSWHIRFEQPGRKVEANRAYTLSFWAKSERAGATNLSLEQTHSPWQNLGMSCQAPLTPEWKPFRFTSIALQSDSDVRQQRQRGEWTPVRRFAYRVTAWTVASAPALPSRN